MRRFGLISPDVAARHVLADRLIHMTVGVARQQHGVLVLRAPRHGIAGENVLRDCGIQEAFRCDHLHLAALHVSFVHHAAHAAEVVDVGMGVDDAHDRTLAELLVDEFERRPGGFLGRQRIEDDPAGIALDEANVGQIIAAHLVDLAGHDLVQAEGHVQDGLALQVTGGCCRSPCPAAATGSCPCPRRRGRHRP